MSFLLLLTIFLVCNSLRQIICLKWPKNLCQGAGWEGGESSAEREGAEREDLHGNSHHHQLSRP